MTNPAPSLSIIIPVKNQEELLEQCLVAIENDARGGPPIEIIVVDNGSTDDSAAIARRHGCVVHDVPVGNVSEVRNHGARLASSEILVFLDSDCIPEDGWLAACRASVADDVVLSGGHYSLSASPSAFERRWCTLLASDVGRPWVPAGNLVVRTEVFTQLGGFSEDLRSAEDQDLCFRAAELGTVRVDERVRVRHEGNPRTVEQMFRTQIWHGSAMVAGARRGTTTKILATTLAFGASVAAQGAGVALRSKSVVVGGVVMNGVVVGYSIYRRRRQLENLSHTVSAVGYFEAYYAGRLFGLASEVAGRQPYYNSAIARRTTKRAA